MSRADVLLRQHAVRPPHVRSGVLRQAGEAEGPQLNDILLQF